MPPPRPVLHALPQPDAALQPPPAPVPASVPAPAPDPEPGAGGPRRLRLRPTAPAAGDPLVADDVLAALLPDLPPPGLSAPVAPEPEPASV